MSALVQQLYRVELRRGRQHHNADVPGYGPVDAAHLAIKAKAVYWPAGWRRLGVPDVRVWVLRVAATCGHLGCKKRVTVLDRVGDALHLRSGWDTPRCGHHRFGPTA